MGSLSKTLTQAIVMHKSSYSLYHQFTNMRVYLLVSFLILATVAPLSTFALKDEKEIRAAIKAKKPEDVLRLIAKQRKDTLNSCNARIYYMGVEAALLQSEKENERIYLQQKPDTAALFQSLNSIFTYALLTDSAEVSELKDKTKQPSHRLRLNRLLNGLYPNLAKGAQYFVRKGDWENARLLARQTLESRNSSIFTEQHPANLSEEQLVTNAVQYLYASFAAGQYHDAERYAALALKDTNKLSSILETLALVNAANKNETGYRHYLQLGVESFPKHLFFFKSLSESLFAHKDYQTLVALSNKLAQKDSNNGLFPLSAAQAYDVLKLNEQSIQAGEQALACDSTLYRAHLYIGRAYYRKARAIQLPLSIRSAGYKEALLQQKEFYEKARPHLEIYRAKAPQDVQEWQPLLYEVYLKLNLGKEFESISQINTQHKS